MILTMLISSKKIAFKCLSSLQEQQSIKWEFCLQEIDTNEIFTTEVVSALMELP